MSNDKYGNETMKIDGKWTLVQPQSGMLYATRYDEGNYDLDNIHFAMMQEIETLREKLSKANAIIDDLCVPF